MAKTRFEPDGGYTGLCPPGLRQSGSHGPKERTGNYRSKLAYLSQRAINSTPIFALTGGLKRQSMVTDPEYRWHKKDYAARNLCLEAAYGEALNGSIDTITVSGSTWMIHEGMQLRNHLTGEIMQVVCAPVFIDPTGKAPVEVQVCRGFADTPTTAFDPTAEIAQMFCGVGKPRLHMIGSAFPEGSCNPSSIHRNPKMYHNWTQIFRKGHSITGTAKATNYRFGSKAAEDKAEIAELFNGDVEMALLFSEMSIGQKDGKIFRTTHGLIPQIRDRAPDNYIIRNPDSIMGITELEEIFQERIFLYGSSEKLAFAGPKTMRTLRQIQRANMQKMEETSNNKVFGRMAVTTFSLMGYTLHVHEHPHFRDAGAPWDSSMLILDMDDLEFLALKGRDVKYRKFSSIETNDCGMDGDIYGWIAELMAVLICAERHGVILNMCEGGEDCFVCATPDVYEHPEPCETCDPCLEPVKLEEVCDPYVCETCGPGGCGCEKGSQPDPDLAPLTDNAALRDAYEPGCDAMTDEEAPVEPAPEGKDEDPGLGLVENNVEPDDAAPKGILDGLE